MQNKEDKKPKIDWIIHFVANGVACDCCNKVENSFPKFMCNAHTHGMGKYNHLDFQIVLHLAPEIIGTLLNDLGTRVQNGEKFVTGDVWSDILVGYDVKFVEVYETDRTVLRVLLPDKNNRFPGDEGCEYPYNQQLYDIPTQKRDIFKPKI